jgi:putative oxidoreductase
MRPLTYSNKNLLNTGILILRIAAGFIIFAHGSGKVFGWFGGQGLEPTIQGFVNFMHIPAWLAYISTFTEFIGGILIIFGLLTRPAALALVINMAVASNVLLHKNFVGGADFPLTLLFAFFAILITGPMNFSLDYLICGKSKSEIPVQNTTESFQ